MTHKPLEERIYDALSVPADSRPKEGEMAFANYPALGIRGGLWGREITNQWYSHWDAAEDWVDSEITMTEYFFLENDPDGGLRLITEIPGPFGYVELTRMYLEGVGRDIRFLVEHKKIYGPNWAWDRYKAYDLGKGSVIAEERRPEV